MRLDVQGLRAIAVLAVVVFHSGIPLSGGFGGVDVFFVISGFVISGALLREVERTGTVSYRSFYRRRLRRLIPAAAVVSMVTLIGAYLFLSPVTAHETTAQAALASSLFVSNVYFAVSSGGYFSPLVEGNPYLHTWSLSVEEQFYFVFPTLVLLLLGARAAHARPGVDELRLRRFTIVVAALCLVSFLLCLWLTFGPFPGQSPWMARLEDYSDRLAFYAPFTRAWEFGLGVLVQLALFARSRRAADAVHRHPHAITLTGWLLLIGSLTFMSDVKFPGWQALLPSLGTALLIFAYGRGHARLGERLLSTAPMTWLGDRSYSWYLWHWPFVVFAAAVSPGSVLAKIAASVLALGAAALTFRYVEEPVRRARAGAGIGSVPRIVLGGIVLPVVLAVAFLGAAGKGWGNQTTSNLMAQLGQSHIDRDRGCFGPTPVGDPSRASCVWPAQSGTAAKGLVLFVGDSHAGHISEAVIGATTSLGYDVEVATFGSCPIVERPEQLSQACEGFVSRSLAFIESHPDRYAAIVTSNASMGYVAKMAGADDYTPAEQLRSEAQTWAQQSAATAARLHRVAPTLVLLDTPGAPGLLECLAPGPLGHEDPACGHYPRDGVTLARSDLVLGLEDAAVRATGAHTMDPRTVLCTERGCSAWQEPGVLRYFDASHLTLEVQPVLEPLVRESLSRTLASRA